MTGKEKCRILKEIRRQIAEKNDIHLVIEECTHKGKCRGTCPRCEGEVRLLERELEKRRAAGMKVALAGISAGFLLTSCTPLDTLRNLFHTEESLEGDMRVEMAEMVTTMGEIAPETAEIEGETIAEEIDGAMPLIIETEEETSMIAGMMIAPAEEEELVLEGDVVWPEEEDGEAQ